MARYLSCEGRRLEKERIMAGLCAFMRLVPRLLTEDEVKQLLKPVDSTELNGVVDKKMIVFMLALTGWVRIVKSCMAIARAKSCIDSPSPCLIRRCWDRLAV